jgi:SAM-dependent methyltransferase
MTKIEDYTEQNRRAWNEIAAVRQQALFPPAVFFAEGGSILDATVRQAVGDAAGRSLLHLQCSTGEETLSWAVVGAQATGVDISDAQIALARQKAAAAQLDVRFIAADVYALPAELQAASFDLVYTGGGAMTWLPDLGRWAAAVASALKPGGRLVLHEEHPLAGCLWIADSKIRVDYNYFARAEPDYSSTWAHFKGGEKAKQTKVEFQWPLGDVVTAVAQAGLRIVALEEFPSNADWRFGEMLDAVQWLPGQYLLVATKA